MVESVPIKKNKVSHYRAHTKKAIAIINEKYDGNKYKDLLYKEKNDILDLLKKRL